MAKLMWDKTGERFYETGVNKGVLYEPNNAGLFDSGVAWNGLTTVTESPSGAEATALYADNIKYLNLISAEEFAATVEAYTFPEEFAKYDGMATPEAGIYVGQQNRRAFGLSYQTRVGNDVEGSEHGYKIHLIYNATAAPSEKAFGTINDSPEAITFSWELSTTPVDAGEDLKPTALITIDSTKADADGLAALEDILYGTAGADPRLPLPAEVFALFSGSVTSVETVAPTYNSSTDIITIPTVTGVIYSIDGEDVSGTYGPITEDKVVRARPAPGYQFTQTSDDDWTIEFA